MEGIEKYIDEIKKYLQEKIKESYGFETKINIEIPPENMGDLAFPVFELSRALKKNPVEIGKDLYDVKLNFIKEVKLLNGYMNFYVDFEPLINEFMIDLKNKGKDVLSFEKLNKKIIIEHTSANPTGPLHVGRARNPIIGDTLARIYRKLGYDVMTHYYVNDAGRQAAILIKGYQDYYRDEEGKEDHVLVKYYQMASRDLENGKIKENDILNIIKEIEMGNREYIMQIRGILKKVLDGIRDTLLKINVAHDYYFWETDLILNGMVKDVENILRNRIKEDQDGSKYIEVENPSGKEKIYLFRKDGTSLYFTRDIAYHIYKYNITKDMINVLGEDHKMHGEALKNILKIIYDDINLENVYYAFVNLPEGRMSTRSGKVIFLDDLLEESKRRALEEIKRRRNEENEKLAEMIGYSAVRYNILKVQNEKQMTFRWEDALNMEGDSSIFLQYSYSRSLSILRKEPWMGNFDFSKIIEEEEFKLLKHMLFYPYYLKKSAGLNKPHYIAKFSYDLASLFNSFYTKCPVLRAPDEIKENRKGIVYAFNVMIEDLMDIMGLHHPEEI
ncbi:MAG: arginine--tRNA ligase [Thermoplasmata archaeon]